MVFYMSVCLCALPACTHVPCACLVPVEAEGGCGIPSQVSGLNPNDQAQQQVPLPAQPPCGPKRIGLPGIQLSAEYQRSLRRV